MKTNTKSKIELFIMKRLRALRTKHGATQEGFAKIAGVNYKYYQSVEAGRRSQLRIGMIERLAAAYGMKCHQLLDPKFSKARLKKG